MDALTEEKRQACVKKDPLENFLATHTVEMICVPAKVTSKMYFRYDHRPLYRKVVHFALFNAITFSIDMPHFYEGTDIIVTPFIACKPSPGLGPVLLKIVKVLEENLPVLEKSKQLLLPVQLCRSLAACLQKRYGEKLPKVTFSRIPVSEYKAQIFRDRDISGAEHFMSRCKKPEDIAGWQALIDEWEGILAVKST